MLYFILFDIFRADYSQNNSRLLLAEKQSLFTLFRKTSSGNFVRIFNCSGSCSTDLFYIVRSVFEKHLRVHFCGVEQLS